MENIKMEFEHIIYQKIDKVAWLSINAPESRNALHLEMRAEILTALHNADADDDVRVIVIRGEGKNFSSGGDIRTMEGVSAVAGRKRLKAGHKLIKAVINTEKLVITSIHGSAAGAGASLAMASDLIIAAAGTKIVMPFVKIGLTPDWGLYYFLVLRVGMTRAKELLLSGDVILAEKAYEIGMINRVVPLDSLVKETEDMAAIYANGPGQAYAMIKSALNIMPTNLNSMLELEAGMQAVAFNSKDFDEGRQAFLEKRAPKFTAE
jgi:2-(1,2-epoxy-1,2-dihydrophenyl)acetyl-CoA isomerase